MKDEAADKLKARLAEWNDYVVRPQEPERAEASWEPSSPLVDVEIVPSPPLSTTDDRRDSSASPREAWSPETRRAAFGEQAAPPGHSTAEEPNRVVESLHVPQFGEQNGNGTHGSARPFSRPIQARSALRPQYDLYNSRRIQFQNRAYFAQATAWIAGTLLIVTLCIVFGFLLLR